MTFRLFGAEHLKAIQTTNDPYTMDFLQKATALCGTPLDIPLFLQKFVKEKVENRIKATLFSTAQRLLRLKTVFEKKPHCTIGAGKKERGSLLLFLSKNRVLIKTKCYFLKGTSEAKITSAKWGEDIDIVFVSG